MQAYGHTYMGKIGNRLSYLQSRNRDTDVENKHTDTQGKREDGVNGEIETDIYTLLCIREKTNENCPHSTGNSTQCSVVT